MSNGLCKIVLQTIPCFFGGEKKNFHRAILTTKHLIIVQEGSEKFLNKWQEFGKYQKSSKLAQYQLWID